jgi:hypothetical protein
MTNDDQDQLVRAVVLIDFLRQNVRTAQDSGATVTADALFTYETVLNIVSDMLAPLLEPGRVAE